MARHNTRFKAIAKAKNFCKKREFDIPADEQNFHCFTCGCRMHLNENCTKLIKVFLDGIKDLEQNALLLWNRCVVLKKRDKLIETASAIRQPKAVDDQKLKTLQADFNEMTKTISTEVVLSEMPPLPSISKHIEIPKPEPIKLCGVRIHGVVESTAKAPREKNEHDMSQIHKMLTFMDIDCKITDVKWLGTCQEEENRIILLQVPNNYH